MSLRALLLRCLVHDLDYNFVRRGRSKAALRIQASLVKHTQTHATRINPIYTRGGVGHHCIRRPSSPSIPPRMSYFPLIRLYTWYMYLFFQWGYLHFCATQLHGVGPFEKKRLSGWCRIEVESGTGRHERCCAYTENTYIVCLQRSHHLTASESPP